MNTQYKHAAQKIIETIDLPSDLFLGLPLLSFTGNKELYLSNHRGILLFSPEEIDVLGENMQIQVKGKSLNIVSYSKEELVINGYISSVNFIQ